MHYAVLLQDQLYIFALSVEFERPLGYFPMALELTFMLPYNTCFCFSLVLYRF